MYLTWEKRLSPYINNVEKVKIKQERSDFVDSLVGGLDLIQDDATKDDESHIFLRYLPTGLQPKHNFYTYARIIYTNCMVKGRKETFLHGDICLSFI